MMVGAVSSNRYSVREMLLAIVTFWCLIPSSATAIEEPSPAALFDVVSAHGSQLASLDSNAAAMTLFTSTVGPLLGLQDAASILSAKGLPSKVAQELGLSKMVQSAHQLMAALAAWQLAESIYRASSATDPALFARLTPSPARQEWLSATADLTELTDLFKQVPSRPVHETTTSSASSPARPELIQVALEVAREAQRQALVSWWSLREWKNRVRQARGLSRLCGTWQWTVHNHQNHQEQKLTMVFPPPGRTPVENSLPAETIVLGDSIYLRWEDGGFVQEDSLLFITQGHKRDGVTDAMKIEGSFLNNRGGWGPISAKRLAACPS
ncbi:MAG: hypothetical protein NHB36_04685 [Nitrospira sp.]|nr:hypothetical protein [Nitrospira sp.]